jgi:hypothetical protein
MNSLAFGWCSRVDVHTSQIWSQQRKQLLYQDGIDDIDSFVVAMHNVENPRTQSSLSC